jgi:hypothetical protein
MTAMLEHIICDRHSESADQMPLGVLKELTHYNEMNNQILDLDVDLWDNARNAIELLSLQLFHGQRIFH